MRWTFLLLVACSFGPSAPEVAEVSPPVTPTPPPGAPVVPLLHPPFDGWYTTSNPFDHAVDPRRSPAGPVLDHTGRWVAGSRDHRGWDFELPQGTPVLASADGVVVAAGPMKPFFCALLGREVSDQLAVVVEHAAPDGTVYATALHHLASVGVEVGESVRRGEPLGASGSSGCSSGPHLHLVVERVDGEQRVPVDPFGWDGGLPDPWAESVRGATSRWLWAEAPPVVVEDSHPPDAAEGRPVVIEAVRYRGWRDAEHPENEIVRLRADPRFAPVGGVPLDGWSLRLPDGHTWPFPPGLVLRPEVPLEVRGGSGTGPALGREQPVLPDSGGQIALLDASGAVADTFTYGLAVQGIAEPAAAQVPFACPENGQGCVGLPLPGGVSGLSFGPDGALAAVVGDPGLPVVLRGGRTVVIDHVAGAKDGPVGAERPRWLERDVLVFDAPRADGVRAVWYASPGLPAAPAIPAPATGEARTVGDAREGLLLVSSFPSGDPELVAWRPQAGAGRVVTRHVLPETAVVLAPGAETLAFLRSGRVHTLSLATGTEAQLLGTARDPALAWLGDRLFAVDRGRLVRRDGEAWTELRGGLVDGVIAAWGEVLGVVDGSEAVLLDADGAELGRHRLDGAGFSELALWTVGGQVRLAWTARFAEGAPHGLGLADLDLAPSSGARAAAAP